MLWYLRGMGYGFHAIGGPMVSISISNRLVLSTSMEDLDTMLSNLFFSKDESLSLPSCTSCNITASFLYMVLWFEALFQWYDLEYCQAISCTVL